jgi:hypothetical protein
MVKQSFSIILILVIVTAFSFCSREGQIITLINVQDGNMDKPVEFDGSGISGETKVFVARSGANETFVLQRTPVQLYSSDYWFCGTILPSTAGNGSYNIQAADVPPVFTFQESEDGRLQVFEENKSVLTYNFGMQLGENVPERYRRSSYIHPLYDLQGNILTADFPDDHYHHRGVSWMWPKVFVDGERYDLWHIYGPEGEYPGIHQVFEKWLFKEAGPVCAVFQLKNFWQLDTQEKVMDERVNIRVFRETESGRAIDISVTWKAIVPIEIEGQDKKGYGGLNFRFADREQTELASIEGKEADSDLKNLPWADLSAKFNKSEKMSGVAIFQDQNNPDFPAGWCLRHYGFLGVAWPGVDRISLKPGDMIQLKARIWVHDGNADEGMSSEAYNVFQNPPRMMNP